MRKRIAKNRQMYLDGAAVGLAGACGLHCLLTPILVIAFPIVSGSFLMREAFHYWVLTLTVPVAALAVFRGCMKHKDRRVAALVCAGIGLLTISVFFGHDLGGETGERAVALCGGVALAAGHVRNFRLYRLASAHRKTV